MLAGRRPARLHRPPLQKAFLLRYPSPRTTKARGRNCRPTTGKTTITNCFRPAPWPATTAAWQTLRRSLCVRLPSAVRPGAHVGAAIAKRRTIFLAGYPSFLCSSPTLWSGVPTTCTAAARVVAINRGAVAVSPTVVRAKPADNRLASGTDKDDHRENDHGQQADGQQDPQGQWLPGDRGRGEGLERAGQAAAAPVLRGFLAHHDPRR